MPRNPSASAPKTPAQPARSRKASAAGAPPKRRQKRLRIDLALQGGGSHGAFTWGVLDRLLEDERLEIAGISGTSAGAMNAVALAAGLMEGGREGARAALRRFWHRVADSSPFSQLNDSPLGILFDPDNPWIKPWIAPLQQAAQYVGSQLSPYQLNPLNLNPLRDILADTVDFEARARLRPHPALHCRHPGGHRRAAHLSPDRNSPPTWCSPRPACRCCFRPWRSTARPTGTAATPATRRCCR